MMNKDEETKTYCVISSFNSDDGFKCFTGYKGENIVKALCIMLPQMSGDCVLDKFNKIWNKIKKSLNTKFNSMLVYDKKYIKAKVREKI